MGGSNSTPASPQLSPDIRTVRSIREISKGHCQDSTPPSHVLSTVSEPSGDYSDRYQSGRDNTTTPVFTPCRDHVDDSDDSECGDEDDDDEEEEECDEDDEDEDDMEEEEEEEECDAGERDEEQTEPRSLTTKSSFSPCRDPASTDNDEVDETDDEDVESDGNFCPEQPVFLPCRDPVSDTNHMGDPDISKTSVWNKETEVNGYRCTSRSKSHETKYWPCRDPENDATRSQNSRSPSRSPKTSPHRDTVRRQQPLVRQDTSPPMSRAHSSLHSQNSQTERSTEKVGTVCGSDSSHQNYVKPNAGGETAIQQHDAYVSCPKVKPCRDPHEKQVAKTNSGFESAELSKRERPERTKDEKVLSGEKIKELQKGCAYLSKKELRKVCNKYREYGCIEDQESEDAEKKKHIQQEMDDVYTLGYSKSGQFYRNNDYSGKFGQSGPGIDSNINKEVVSVGEAEQSHSRLILQQATLLSCTTQNNALTTTETFTIEEKNLQTSLLLNKNNTLKQNNRTAKDVTEDEQIRYEPNSASPERKDDSKNSTPNKSGTKRYKTCIGTKRTKSKSPSPKKYEILSNRPLRDQLNDSHKTTQENLKKSDTNNSCCTISGLQPDPSVSGRNGVGVLLENKSNSNNLDVADTHPPDTCITKDDRTFENYSNSRDIAHHECAQVEVDDLWFECWENDTVTAPPECAYAFNTGIGNKNTIHIHNSAYDFDEVGYEKANIRSNGNDHGFLCSGKETMVSEVGENNIMFSKTLIKPPIDFKWDSLGETQDDSMLSRIQIKKDFQTEQDKSNDFQNINHDLSTILGCNDGLLPFQRQTHFSSCIANDFVKNTNSNADSLLHTKKKSQENIQRIEEQQNKDNFQNFLSSTSDTFLEQLKKKMIEQGKPVFDFELARGLGLSNMEIRQLLDSVGKVEESKQTAIELLSKQMNIDFTSDLRSSKQRAKQLVDCSAQVSSHGSSMFDIDLGLDMGQVQQLIDPTSERNHIESLSMPEQTLLDPQFAMSMGLTNDQFKQLADFSDPTKEMFSKKVDDNKFNEMISSDELRTKHLKNTGVFDQDQAKNMGLTANQIKQLIDSSTQKARYEPFNKDLAKQMGLTDSQIQKLADSSAEVSRNNSQNQVNQVKTVSAQTSRAASGVFDKDLARDMGLNEAQIKLLTYSSKYRLKGESMFDPDLAKKMGLSINQIKQLEASSSQVTRGNSVTFDVGVAKDIGLSDSQIKGLVNSSTQVSRKHSDLQPILYDLAKAKSLDMNSQEIRQLMMSAQVSSDLPAAAPDGDGIRRENILARKQRLVSKLRASVAQGDKVGDVLTTLLEWNSILLVIIFLLLVATSCPGPARPFLSCPMPSACQVLHRYVILPLRIDQALHWVMGPPTPSELDRPTTWSLVWEYMFGGRSKEPPQGIVYTLLYRSGKAIFFSMSKVLSYVYNEILLPVILIPVNLITSFLGTIYTALLCTVRTSLYGVFYVCGFLLGIPIPVSLTDLQVSDGQTNVAVIVKDSKTVHQASAGAENAEGRVPLRKPTRTFSEHGPSEKDEMPQQPFNPDQGDLLTSELQGIHQHGGFLFYIGFDPPKKGCNYSSFSTLLLSLLWSLPKECA